MEREAETTERRRKAKRQPEGQLTEDKREKDKRDIENQEETKSKVMKRHQPKCKKIRIRMTMEISERAERRTGAWPPTEVPAIPNLGNMLKGSYRLLLSAGHRTTFKRNFRIIMHK